VPHAKTHAAIVVRMPTVINCIAITPRFSWVGFKCKADDYVLCVANVRVQDVWKCCKASRSLRDDIRDVYIGRAVLVDVA